MTVALAGCSTAPKPVIESPGVVQSTGGKVAIGKPMPDFAYTDMAGKAVKLSDYKGKVLVVDIFSPS